MAHQQSVPEQFCLSLEAGSFVSTEKKEWYRKELKEVTMELWFNPQSDKGVLICTSDESIVVMYKQGKYVLYLNKKKMSADANVIPQDTIPSIESGKWQHVAVTVSVEQKSAILYHNCQAVLSYPNHAINLKKTAKSQLLIAPEFSGSITEVRVWKCLRSLDQLKSNKCTPLSIVSEMTAAIVIIDLNRLEKRGTKSEETTDQTEPKGFDFGFGEKIPPKPVPDTVWDFQKPKEDSGTPSRKSSAKIGKQTPSASGSGAKTGKKGSGADISPSKENEQPKKTADWGISLPPSDLRQTKPTPSVVEASEPAAVANEKLAFFSDKGFLPEYQQALKVPPNIQPNLLFSVEFVSGEKFAAALSGYLQQTVAQVRALFLQDKLEEALESVDKPFRMVVALASQAAEEQLHIPQTAWKKMSASLGKLMPYKLFVYTAQHVDVSVIPFILSLETSPTDKTLFSVAMITHLYRNRSEPAVVMQLLGYIQQLNKKDRLSDSQRKECGLAAAWASKERKGVGLGPNWNQKDTNSFYDPLVG